MDNAILAWDVGPGSAVGNLSLNDDEVDVLNKEFQFILAEGDGDTNNYYFEIVGILLKIKDELSLHMDTSYSIRVQATFSDGESIFEMFEIVVDAEPTSD